MTTHALHGNHDPCPACEMRREVQDTAPVLRAPIPCNSCGGSGFIPLSNAEIIRRTVQQARLTFWPARYLQLGIAPPSTAPDPEASHGP